LFQHVGHIPCKAVLTSFLYEPSRTSLQKMLLMLWPSIAFLMLSEVGNHMHADMC
jgi:hypothetical protein